MNGTLFNVLSSNTVEMKINQEFHCYANGYRKLIFTVTIKVKYSKCCFSASLKNSVT